MKTTAGNCSTSARYFASRLGSCCSDTGFSSSRSKKWWNAPSEPTKSFEYVLANSERIASASEGESGGSPREPESSSFGEGLPISQNVLIQIDTTARYAGRSDCLLAAGLGRLRQLGSLFKEA